MNEVLLVAAGGALGAVLRWAVALLGRDDFPWPTLAVNVAGSLLLGAVARGGPDWALVLLGSGVAGALTTYSAFALDTMRLPRVQAAVYVVASLALGSAAFALGWALG
ncbi:MAG: fluoride efflux transporter FluC [Nocardioides sp.]